MKSNQLILFAIISIATTLFVFNCQTARSVNALTKNGALAGVWTGASVCADDAAPCGDEKIVIRVAESDADGRISLTMSSFSENGTESTTRLDCAGEPKARALRCADGQNIWQFKPAGNQMTGTLTLADGRLERRLDAGRSDFH